MPTASAVTGNVVSLVMGGLICYVWSMIAPEDYDFESMKHIKMIDDEDAGGHHGFASVSHFFSAIACFIPYSAVQLLCLGYLPPSTRKTPWRCV